MTSNPTTTQPSLNTLINDCLRVMRRHDLSSSEYLEHLSVLERLYELRDEPRKPVSLDSVLQVSGQLLGILIIVGYERGNVMTSKAISFVSKLR